MRLIKFHCDGDEYFINPDKIMYVHQSKHKRKDDWTDGVRINLVDDIGIMVDESFKEVISRINNQEFNLSHDLFGKMERLELRVKSLTRNTQPAEI